jgi:hypothetical protein
MKRGRQLRLNARFALCVIGRVVERRFPVFRSWGNLSHFQPKEDIRPQSLGSYILPSLDGADLFGDLCRSRDLVALGEVVQIQISGQMKKAAN